MIFDQNDFSNVAQLAFCPVHELTALPEFGEFRLGAFRAIDLSDERLLRKII